jgi:predicted amidohydrolase
LAGSNRALDSRVMSTIRVAVASTPLTTTLAEAVPAALVAVEQAARQGARIVCLPETGLPGHRVQDRPVPSVEGAQVEQALDEIARAARRSGVAVIVGAERPDPGAGGRRRIVSVVIDAGGRRLGEQAKTQIDPSEEADYLPGVGRRTFETAGLTFGVAICHEAFRYPEIVRALVLAGAQVVFVPHFVTTEGGGLPTRWGDSANPYNEKALLLRALENGVFVAASNVSGPDQGSISGIIDPLGKLVTSLAYGQSGVASADLDLDLADRRLALRWAPERNVIESLNRVS